MTLLKHTKITRGGSRSTGTRRTRHGISSSGWRTNRGPGASIHSIQSLMMLRLHGPISTHTQLCSRSSSSSRSSKSMSKSTWLRSCGIRSMPKSRNIHSITDLMSHSMSSSFWPCRRRRRRRSSPVHSGKRNVSISHIIPSNMNTR